MIQASRKNALTRNAKTGTRVCTTRLRRTTVRILGAIRPFTAKVLTMTICHATDNIQINTGHCAFAFCFAIAFSSLTRFPSPTVGPRVYPGCGLVRRGMQARSVLSHISRKVTDFFCWTRVSNYRKRSVRYCRGAFYHNETQLTHFSFRRERQLQLAPWSATPSHRNRVLKKTSMSIVCYANNCTRHMQRRATSG